MKKYISILERCALLLCVIFLVISVTFIAIAVGDDRRFEMNDNMVFVKGGCFQMGDVFSDVSSNEKPVHEVCVDDFYMGKYEVMVGEFMTFVKESGYVTEAEWQDGCHVWSGRVEIKEIKFNWRNTNSVQTDRDPVICVSWNDANAYLKWLSEKEGRHYRLPTEAEWEYAARSKGKAYRHSWGNGSPTENRADITAQRELLGKTVEHGYDDGYAITSPAGSFKPNELGLYDISGNVSEWVADWFSETYYSDSSHNNPQGPENGKCKVIRGNSWNPLLRPIQTTTRLCSIPGGRGSWLGFRMAASVESSKVYK